MKENKLDNIKQKILSFLKLVQIKVNQQIEIKKLFLKEVKTLSYYKEATARKGPLGTAY